MNKRIENHVSGLFASVASNRQVLDIEEELLSNLNDKFNDLISAGKSEDEAFSIVVASIGDIQSLLGDITNDPKYYPQEIEKNRRLRGLLISIGVAFYVLSLALLLPFLWMDYDSIGVIAMICMCALATGFVVFGVNIGNVRYEKTDDTFVEQYREKTAVGERRTKLRNAISSSLWTLIAVVYLALSFISGWWHMTWIIFLVGALLQLLVVWCFMDKAKSSIIWHFVLWTVTLIAYFVVSFTGFNIWAWSWLIFLFAAAVEQLVRLVVLWRCVA
jgi:hypothetical protein